MQYISLEDFDVRILLVKNRDLSEEDILKISKFPSWPIHHAVYYALGKFPLVPVGGASTSDLDHKTPMELSKRYVGIFERATAAIRAGDFGEHVKPLVFLKWLAINGDYFDPRLYHSVVQNEREKEKRTLELEGTATEIVPQFILPTETDQDLYLKAVEYASSLTKAEDEQELSLQRQGALKTGMHIRVFKQKAFYRALLYMKYGCTCNHTNLSTLISADLAKDTGELKKVDKIPTYIEVAVIAALEATENQGRICSKKRYPNGKNGPLPCLYHCSEAK